MRGSLIMYALTFWACMFTIHSLIGLPTLSELLFMILGLGASIGAALLLVNKYSILWRFVRDLSERLTIFVYIWIPLSLFSLLFIIFRVMGRMLGV